MTWLLDTGPLDRLAQVAERSSWSWPGALVHVVDMVEWESRSNNRVCSLLARESTEGKPWIRVHEIELGSSAQVMYSDYLRTRQDQATRNAGEDASIALCACQLPDAILVVADKQAALWAMIELGHGRVASEFDCWKWLLDEGHIDRESFRELCRCSQRALSDKPEQRAKIPYRFAELLFG